MTKQPAAGRSSTALEGQDPWLWYVGGVRIGVLAVVSAGTHLLLAQTTVDPLYLRCLDIFYGLGFFSCLWYLCSLWWVRPARPLLTWAQLLVDFGVVAATVSFTGGTHSHLAFLFVVVILEAGLLLSPAQGFVFATLATIFMLLQLILPSATDFSAFEKLPPWSAEPFLNRGYNFLVQALAYYLTASISGYWNQRVRRMQHFQREILDNMNNGFLITDTDGLISAQNQAADRLLGLEEKTVVGLPVQEILRVADGSECPVLTALRTQRDFTRYEFNAIVGDNQVKLLGLSTSCMHDYRGRLTGVIASFSDLTELARMREELQRQDRLAAIGELAAGLAHEIRNPVAAIRGALEELGSGVHAPDLVARLAGISIREADHLNYIVSEFLDFAREPRVERKPFDLSLLLQEVASLLQREYDDRDGIGIELVGATTSHMVSGDRGQLKQVFVNIAKNAVEAMKDRGHLRITMSRDAVSLIVRFDDEGPGIPPDEVIHIFEPFFTTKDSGVGMGLAVCMRIVTAHDGTIHVSSREEGGTSITVRLPASPTASEETAAS